MGAVQVLMVIFPIVSYTNPNLLKQLNVKIYFKLKLGRNFGLK